MGATEQITLPTTNVHTLYFMGSMLLSLVLCVVFYQPTFVVFVNFLLVVEYIANSFWLPLLYIETFHVVGDARPKAVTKQKHSKNIHPTYLSKQPRTAMATNVIDPILKLLLCGHEGRD